MLAVWKISDLQDGNYTCPDGSCACRNIFGSPCRSLGLDIVLSLEAQSVQFVAGWLQIIGLQDIQTVQGNLFISFRGPGKSLSWTLDIFPHLEAVTSRVLIYRDIYSTSDFSLTLLPGKGFSNLRAVGSFELVTLEVENASPWNQNTDLSFLSSLECVGIHLYLVNLQNLTSLKGLERIRDGSPPAYPLPFIYSNGGSTSLTDVSALAGYARCGLPDQRPDSQDNRPDLALPCGTLKSWPAVCTYISQGTCT
jgi:hypothetical protein